MAAARSGHAPAHADPRHRSTRQGRLCRGRHPDRRRPRRHGARHRRARLRGARARRARLHAGRPHRRRPGLRRRPRPRRRHPRRRDPRADAQPAPRRLLQQPDGDVQRDRGGNSLLRAARGERIQRDRPRLLLPRARVPARLRAGRRAAPDPPAGPLRDRQALRRAADGRRGAALGSHRRVDPPELGAVGGQLLAQPLPRAARPRGHAVREPVGLHRRLRPRRRPAAGRRARHARPRGRLHRLPRQPRQPAARGARPPPPRRRDRAARARPRGRVRDLDPQGPRAARLRPLTLVARLPHRRRRAASRGGRSGSSARRPGCSAAGRSPARRRPRRRSPPGPCR